MIQGVPQQITKQLLLSCNIHRRPNNNVKTIAEKAYEKRQGVSDLFQ